MTCFAVAASNSIRSRCAAFAKANTQFLDEPRFAETGLTHDQHQLAIAVPCSFPAPHQYRYLFLATNQWREMTLARAPSATTRSYKLEQRHRLWNAFQFMAAALLGDEETSDLALHLRSHDNSTWLCQCLHPRGGVGRIAINLTRRVDYDRAGFDADARLKRRLARTRILAIDVTKRALDGESRSRRPFGVVFLRHWIAE
jgi:hypothetical protein